MGPFMASKSLDFGARDANHFGLNNRGRHGLVDDTVGIDRDDAAPTSNFHALATVTWPATVAAATGAMPEIEYAEATTRFEGEASFNNLDSEAKVHGQSCPPVLEVGHH